MSEGKTNGNCDPKVHEKIGHETRFKPGQSGNPKGGPFKARLRAALKRVLKRKVGQKAIALNGYDLLAEAVIDHAKNGNFPYCKLTFDRVDGLVDAITEDYPASGPYTIRDSRIDRRKPSTN